jgi:aromatic ring-opening dioxygenase catalytic subunit (LigB family)
MARSKKSNKNDLIQDFDEFDEELVEVQYGIKIKNLGRTSKKQKKLKFDGDDIQW